MAWYTVQVQASDKDEAIWQGMHPAENAKGQSAEEVARWTAQNQNVAFGDHWRVVVWEGANADTSSTPLDIHWPGATETE